MFESLTVIRIKIVAILMIALLMNKASEKKRNICDFNKLCVFFNPYIDIYIHTHTYIIYYVIYSNYFIMCINLFFLIKYTFDDFKVSGLL